MLLVQLTLCIDLPDACLTLACLLPLTLSPDVVGSVLCEYVLMESARLAATPPESGTAAVIKVSHAHLRNAWLLRGCILARLGVAGLMRVTVQLCARTAVCADQLR